jgi:hypothetical protein
MVSAAESLLIMLDDQQGISEVTELREEIKQA